MNYFISACLALILIQVLMVFIWKAAYLINKTSIVDIFWSLLIFAASFFYFLFSGNRSFPALLGLFLVGIWALRLAVHIGVRSWGKKEDARYGALRKKWGPEESKKMLIFYFQQGFAAWFFALPFLLLFLDHQTRWGLWQAAGVFIWAAAFIGEALSDYQLYSFKQNPQNSGKVCRVGFWRYSRHPNYFFEWLIWVAFAWIVLPYSGGWLAVFCPVLMYYFLNQVSGIPLAEKQALASRPTEYEEYRRTTSSFFLWPPKKQESSS